MDGEEYENLRNLTLMFFLDRLMDKGQPRTLHDLSCQFGTKGFTKEMRQIAGGSQSGLRKFLSQYPSLFTIDGDNVFITKVGVGKDSTKTRDYVQEAVDYFVHKLQMYGDAEVPIRSLLGHRSQAPLEIRHVSGHNARDFCDFLLKRSDTFVVTDEYVVLKSVVDRMGGIQEIKRLSSEEENKVDPYLTQQLVCSLEAVIFAHPQKRVSVDNLFNQLKDSGEMYTKLVRSSGDLITILKMNATSFHVHARDVDLTSQRLELLQNPSDQVRNRSLMDPSAKSFAPRKDVDMNRQETSMKGSVMERKTSIRGTNLQDRMRQEVLRAVSQNKNLEHNNNDSRKDANNSALMKSSSHPIAPPVDANLLLANTRIVSNSREAEEIVTSLMKSSLVDGIPTLAIDLEGVNLGKGGSVTIVQLASMNRQVYLFDVLQAPDMMEKVLKPMLESSSVLKILHDCKNDSCALHFNHRVTLEHVFDTQVAHAVIQQQESGKAAYKLKSGSLNALVELYGKGLLPINSKKDSMKKVYRRNPRFWAQRPLTQEMILYAAADVYVLVPDLYLDMRSRIRPEYEPLFQTMTRESIYSSISPAEVRANKKSRKTDLEVTDLKAKLYNHSDAKVLVLSNREIRLLR